MSVLQKIWNFKQLPGCSMEDAAQIITQPQDSFDAVHTWYQNGNAYQGLVLYEQRFWVDFQPNQRVFITFGAADRWCKVFVNGQFAGEHQGGYSAFTFEITNLCTNGENNNGFNFLQNIRWLLSRILLSESDIEFV